MHTPLNKAFVALAMSILAILDLVFGAKLGISEDIVTVIIAILTPLLVYLVPNAKEE